MTFCDVVEKIPGLHGHCQPGLKALRDCERRLIVHEDPRKLAGSVDLDAAMKRFFPQEHRWDYVVAEETVSSQTLHWIEVHPATSSGHCDDVSKKMKWLREWLSHEGKALDLYPRVFNWVASGKSFYNQRSPQVKQMASRGVLMVGERYTFKS